MTDIIQIVPKEKPPKTERWEVDEFWQVTNGKLLFAISDVLLIQRFEFNAGGIALSINFPNGVHTTEFEDKESRDGVWELLVATKRAYLETLCRNQERYLNK